jgi:hypothetical protein
MVHAVADEPSIENKKAGVTRNMTQASASTCKNMNEPQLISLWNCAGC